ncbi:motility associated factor glycosyltransferase family protein [Chrysiogenes arsenatis]|uniref:motility associated factor glycosyltransferase family protein n=1 Tax=Chrysiogenes arsenatis TaxID=309797 RepID=UPI00040799A5|nr:6-hydroxymethylpterin diphosphokinase MptE-like protein [Chrysiogenes arsenatis]
MNEPQSDISTLLSRMQSLRSASATPESCESERLWEKNLAALEARLPSLVHTLRHSALLVRAHQSVPCDFSKVRTDVDSMLLVLGADAFSEFLQAAPSLGMVRKVVILEHQLAPLKKLFCEVDLSESFRSGILDLVVAEHAEWNLMIALRQQAVDHPWLLALSQSVQVIGNAHYISFQKDFYTRYIEAVKIAFNEAKVYYGNDPHDSLIGIENMFDNLDLIIDNPGIMQMKGKMAGTPAFIIATGPSLTEALPLLPQAAQRGFVFACDYSVKHLIDANAPFHFVVSLERNPFIAKFFRDYDLRNHYLFTPPLQHRHILTSFTGKKIITYRNVKHFDWLGIPKGQLDIKSSVANMAFAIADYLGCSPIVLVGQDLCYGSDGATHAAGAIFGAKQEEVVRQQRLHTRGNSGDMVETNQIWFSCIKSYETDIARSHARCINTTMRGAAILGTELQELSEVLAHLPKRAEADIWHIIDHSLALPTRAEKRKYARQIIKRIQQGINECDQIIRTAESSLHAIHQFLEHDVASLLNGTIPAIDPSRVASVFSSVEQAKSAIAQCGKETFMYMVMHVAQSFVIDDMIEEKKLFFQYADPTIAKINAIARYPRWVAEIKKHTLAVRKIIERTAKQTYLSPTKP